MTAIRARRIAFTCPWFDVVAKDTESQPGDGRETYYAVKTRDYCTAVAVTPEGKFILVRQFRPATETVTLELPSGCVEPGEDPAKAMARELLEETGFHAPRGLECLGALHQDSGRLQNTLWAYFAPEAVPVPGAAVKEAGLETHLCDAKELRRLIAEGTFRHAPHLGLVALAAWRGRVDF